MRILDTGEKTQFLALNFFAVAARVGFIASTWVLLVERFQINPMVAATMSVCVQGFTVAIKPMSSFFIEKYGIGYTQRIGSGIGITSVVLIALSQRLSFFLIFVLLGSFSKVALEGTFPLQAHAYINAKRNFSSTLIATQQGSVLFVSALIAPFALAGQELVPIMTTLALYLIALAIATRTSRNEVENNSVLCASASGTNLRGNDLTKTLSLMDLAINVVSATSLMLMPLVFIEISKVSQGMDSTLNFVYGLFAIAAGLILSPIIQKHVLKTTQDFWKFLVLVMTLSLITPVLYSTYFGVFVALFGAALQGLCFVSFHSNLNNLAANELDRETYQVFAAKLMQRNAISRMIVPIIAGMILSLTSIGFVIVAMILFSSVFTCFMFWRVTMLHNGFDLNNFGAIKSAYSLRLNRRTINIADIAANFRYWKTIFGSGFVYSSYYRLSFYPLARQNLVTFSQEVQNVDSTRGSPRLGRNSS